MNAPYKAALVETSPSMHRWFKNLIVKEFGLRIVGMVGAANEGRVLNHTAIPNILILGRVGSVGVAQMERFEDQTHRSFTDSLATSAVSWALRGGTAILSGLGGNGAHGMLAPQRNVIAREGQSKESVAVSRMPAAESSMKACEVEAPITEIASEILTRLFQQPPSEIDP